MAKWHVHGIRGMHAIRGMHGVHGKYGMCMYDRGFGYVTLATAVAVCMAVGVATGMVQLWS